MKAIALAACLAISPVYGQTQLSRSQTFQRRAAAGQETRVFTYVQFHRDCRPSEPPNIVMRSAPGHGAASVRPDTTTVTVMREGGSDCRGRVYSGLGIYYIPAAGFQGTDRFEWDVINGSTIDHDSAVVEVK